MTTNLFGDLIYSYSRSQAISDGVLIPAPADMCKEAGILLPLCITDHLWSLVEPENLDSLPGQSGTGRLWDLLWLFRVAAAHQKPGSSRLKYTCSFQVKKPGCPARTKKYKIIAVCGPGDSEEPVLTLMLPEDE